MPSTYETSEDIVAGICQGDREAEKALVEKYSRTLIYILEKRVGDVEQARDLHQETFLIVLQKLRKESISDPSKLAAYLHKTAINLHIGVLRKEGRRKTIPNSEIIDLTAGKAEEQFSQLQKERASFAIREIIGELKNHRDREILLLYYVQERDKAEICSKLDLSPRHFDRVISRARSRFRNALESHSEESLLEIRSAQ